MIKESEKNPAIVLGLSANGLSVARSLGRKGIPVIGVDSSSCGPARFSRYVREFILALGTGSGEELLGALLSIGKRFSCRPVLLATADEYVSFVSANRNELVQRFDFLFSSPEIIESFLDKRKTSEFCETHNIPHPKTFFLEHDELLEKVLGTIEYPCIIKPQDSHIWRQYFDEKKAFVVNSGKELADVYDQVKAHRLNVVIQQIIPGPDNNIYQFLAFCNKKSEILASFCCRKIRQYPPHFGIACLCESVENPLIVEMGKKVLGAMPYKGMIALEFKIDGRNQQPIFLEANLRTSFFGELAVASGVDFPYLIYRNLVFGEHTVRENDYVKNVKLWNIELDLGCLFRLRKQGEITFLEWLKGLKAKKIAHTYFAFDDWGPWFIVYAKLVRVVFTKMTGKIFSYFRRDKKITFKKKGINVLHLISSSGLFGAENIVLSLGKNIRDKTYHSIVGALHDPRRPEPEIIEKSRELGIESCFFKCHGRFDLGAVFRLKKYIIENGIDLLHTHNYKSDVIGFLVSRLTGVPVMATAHGFTDMTRSVSLYEKLDRWVLKSFFKRIVVVTNSMLKDFPKEKKRVISNGVDIGQLKRDESRGHETRRLYHIGNEDIVIGTVGRLSYEKNQIMILEAAYPIMRKDERIKILIVGDGPKKAELKQFAAARHLEDRVLFTGLMRDTVSAYSSMDIFVLSSLTEGAPLTLLEAMAMELPVIATRVGGIPEIINDGKNGLLVNSRDADALRGKMNELIANKEKAREISGSVRGFVKSNYSLERMCREYKKVYSEILNLL